MVEQVLRQLPVGISDWNSIRAGNYFFIDKTRMLRNLLLGGMDKVFLARPSGMGRTTLLSMIEELFTHGDQNFVGTDIYGKWPENERYPVIRLDFSQIQGDPCCADPWAYAQSFSHALRHALVAAFTRVGLPEVAELERALPGAELFLLKLHYFLREHPIVLLLDNCDAPLRSNLGDQERYSAILSVLKPFYLWVDSNGSDRFAFITGTLRCRAEGLLFSGHNIQDISMDPLWSSGLVGVTEQELTTCYAPYLEVAAQRLHCSVDEFLVQLQHHYGGRYFDYEAKRQVYSPFSLNNFFVPLSAVSETIPEFGNFGLSDGQAQYELRQLLATHQVNLSKLLELAEHDVDILDCDLMNPNYFNPAHFLPLLTETGFLTLKEVKPQAGDDYSVLCRCGIPNCEIAHDFACEVQAYFFSHIKDYAITKPDWVGGSVLRAALARGDLQKLCTQLNVLLSNIDYEAYAPVYSSFYRSALLLWLGLFLPEVTAGADDLPRYPYLKLKSEQGPRYILCCQDIHCGAYPDSTPERVWQEIDQKVLVPAMQRLLHRDDAVQDQAVITVVFAIEPAQHRIVAWRSSSQEGENFVALSPLTK